MWRRGTVLQASVYILHNTSYCSNTLLAKWEARPRSPHTRLPRATARAQSAYQLPPPCALSVASATLAARHMRADSGRWSTNQIEPTCSPNLQPTARDHSKSITRQPLQYSVSRSVPCFMPPWLHSRSRSCRFCRVNHRAIFHVSALVPGAKLSDSSSLTSWNPNALYIFLAGVKRLFV